MIAASNSETKMTCASSLAVLLLSEILCYLSTLKENCPIPGEFGHLIDT